MFIVIGRGALGVGLGVALKQQGFEVGFIGRSGPTALEGVEIDGRRHSPSPVLFSFPRPTAQNIENAEAIFVAVKAYQLIPALTQHLPSGRGGRAVIPVGNGLVLPELDRLSKDFPTYSWRVGICTIASTLLTPNRYRLNNSSPAVTWGPYPSGGAATRGETLLFGKASDIFKWLEDPLPPFRRKWIYNTALNTLCGAQGLSSNGEALQHKDLLSRLFDEAYGLADKLWPGTLASSSELFEGLIELIERTKSNRNSMAQDRSEGKRTESDYLAGVALQYPGFPLLKEFHHRICVEGDIFPAN